MVNQNILILRPKFNIFWAIFIRLFLTFNTSAFCDIQTKSELRLATNLLKEEEEQVINQEIMEIYIQISSGKF
jgi:hypothetical protein